MLDMLKRHDIQVLRRARRNITTQPRTSYQLKRAEFPESGGQDCRNPQTHLSHRLTCRNCLEFRAKLGFPVEQTDFDHLDRLPNIVVTLFVGDRDDYWKEGTEKTRDLLASLGKHVDFEVIPRNGHSYPSVEREEQSHLRTYQMTHHLKFWRLPWS